MLEKQGDLELLPHNRTGLCLPRHSRPAGARTCAACGHPWRRSGPARQPPGAHPASGRGRSAAGGRDRCPSAQRVWRRHAAGPGQAGPLHQSAAPKQGHPHFAQSRRRSPPPWPASAGRLARTWMHRERLLVPARLATEARLLSLRRTSSSPLWLPEQGIPICIDTKRLDRATAPTQPTQCQCKLSQADRGSPHLPLMHHRSDGSSRFIQLSPE